MFDPSLAARIESVGIVAVLVIDRVEDAPPLARALLAGGVTAMELTLRTPVALDALRAVREAVPEMIAGVGTILTTDQIHAVVEAGGAFGVSPGVSPRVLAEARAVGLSFAPGIATPTDIELALEAGCELMKFFPAEPLGGLAYLRAISAPYLHRGVRFLPLGGVNAENMASYLAEPVVAALGGSWLAPRDAVRDRNWAQITALAKSATEGISKLRKS